MIPETLPRDTTREQWERYVTDKRNHEARIRNKRAFLHDVLEHAEKHGAKEALKHFYHEIDKEQFMDAPNPPGYYRANND